MRIVRQLRFGVFGLVLGFFAGGALSAEDGYRLPPPAIVETVDAAPAPSTSTSPDRQWLILIDRDAMPSIADLSRPMLRLAGMRIDPQLDARFRTSFNRGLRLRPLRDPQATPVEVPLPEGARLVGVTWSHRSDRFLITIATENGQELWDATVENPTSPRRLTDRLNTIYVSPRYLSDGMTVACVRNPANRGPAPIRPAAPSGPIIQETAGETSPLRTVQDLLRDSYDASLFEHHITTQLSLIAADGTVTDIGSPVPLTGVSFSPDRAHILATMLKKPWSYTQAHWSFPRSYSVHKRSGTIVKMVADVPLAKDIPIGGVRTGPRNLQWHPMRPATLLWVEALDGGNPKQAAEHRDRWLAWEAPFTRDPVELTRLEHRSRGLSFLRSPTHFVFTEYDRDRRWTRSTLIDIAHPDVRTVLDDRSVRDRYANPGSMVMERRPGGIQVALQRGDWIFRTGEGASARGIFPFVSQQNVKTGETRTMWECADGVYERPAAVWEEDGAIQVLTRHESPTSQPNLRWHTIGGENRVITHFPDPTPKIRGVKKELLRYERADGVPLSGTLYLPADYREGEKLPLLVWAYPREYNDAKTAGQVTVSPYRFTRIGGSSHLHLVTQGYAILDGATVPIIGDPETMNDTFIEQLVSGAQAAIDVAVEKGVADRNRVAVGGHSYGAFMTANLLAHCDLFHAGIARSGAYNRTLTPFGFQSERRTLWEAPQAYFGISPFMHAHKIQEPILLIHGAADNNSGTYPMQSRRMFSALQGNGGTARLVMLPNESHGYRGRESVLHALSEMVDWLDLHVKNRDVAPAGFDESSGR